MVFFNALQDSIMVKREKKDSSLSQFCLDKLKRPYENHIQALIPFLRPEFVAGCTCLQMHTYGPLMYCPKCTKWKIQQQDQSGTSTTTTTTLSFVGKLTFHEQVADAVAKRYCVVSSDGKFDVDATFQTCASIFHLAGLAELAGIGVPKTVILGFVLRDSFFVKKWNDKIVSWSEYFKVKEGSFGAGEALLLLRIGLAIGTLGAIS